MAAAPTCRYSGLAQRVINYQPDTISSIEEISIRKPRGTQLQLVMADGPRRRLLFVAESRAKKAVAVAEAVRSWLGPA